jgi:hypothetical protein
MNVPPHDSQPYWEFTGPQQRDKALRTLLGILEGFAMDKVVNILEHDELVTWMETYSYLEKRDSAFAEMTKSIRRAMSDGILTVDETEDLIALCHRIKDDSPYFSVLTNVIQELQGIAHGLIADVDVNEAELRQLQAWLESAEPYLSYWPVGEIESVVTAVLRDGRIDEGEHRFLLHFFSEFASLSEGRMAQLPPLAENEILIGGICSLAPSIEFEGKSFCFTGFSEKASRSDFAERVIAKSGIHAERVRQDVDYLIVCDGGNACWAFACYGRKVEKAMEYRRSGHPIVLVHERDFWDALSE